MKFQLDADKAIESSLYILGKLPSCDFHKLFKILYFADQQHLVAYGRPITGDEYIAMNNGPVPSFIYDILKIVRGGNNFIKIDRNIAADFEVIEDYYVGAKRNANTDYLSVSDVEFLDKSIEENAKLNFEQLTQKSHDSAWQKASNNYEINALDIASAAGANIEMLKYIESNIANRNAFL